MIRVTNTALVCICLFTCARHQERIGQRKRGVKRLAAEDKQKELVKNAVKAVKLENASRA